MISTLLALLLVVGVQEPNPAASADDVARLEDLTNEVRTLFDGCNAAIEARDFQSARDQVASATAVLAASQDAATEGSIPLWRSLVELASTCGATEPYHRAAEGLVTALQRAESADPSTILEAQDYVAHAKFQLHDLDGAQEICEATLEARRATLPADDPSIIANMGRLGAILGTKGDFEAARELQEQVLAAREAALPALDDAVLSARGDLASTLHALGEYERAHATFLELIDAYNERGDADQAVMLYLTENLAVTKHSLGDLEGARGLMERALETRLGVYPPDHGSVLHLRSNLAVTKRFLGDYEGSRAQLEAVLEVIGPRLPDDHPNMVLTRANLAGTLFQLGDLEGARELFAQVVAVREAELEVDHPDLLRAQLNLAGTIGTLGDFEEALALERHVLEVRSRSLAADHPDLLRVRGDVAALLMATGDLEGAMSEQSEVLGAYEARWGSGHPRVLSARQALALTLTRMQDREAARRVTGDLVQGMNVAIADSLPLSAREIRATAASLEARLGMALFLEQSNLDSPAPGSLFELIETMRSAVDSSRGVVGSRTATDEVKTIQAELLRVRTALNDRMGAGESPEGRDEAAAEVRRLAEERDRLERKLRAALGESGVFLDAIGARELADALGPRAVAVGYRRYVRRDSPESGLAVAPAVPVTTEHGVPWLLAHVLRSDGMLTRIDLGPAREIEELVQAWRASMGTPLQRGIGSRDADQANTERAAGERLRSRVLDPVLAAAGEGVDEIHVCVDGALHLAPLGALPTGSDARLGDELRIAHHVSFARMIHPLPPLGGKAHMLALGGVDFDEDPASDAVAVAAATTAPVASTSRGGRPEHFDPLVQTALEIDAVVGLYSTTIGSDALTLRESGASKAALRAAVAGRRYVHLATHGWFAPESVRSIDDDRTIAAPWSPMSTEEVVNGFAPMTLCGLALAGANIGRTETGEVVGILTAEELAGYDLSACELAVLSACETNLGTQRAGQGMRSLQAALHAAGVRHSVTSLWRVDDAATRKLMEYFYTALWVDGAPVHEALWKAKSRLRSQGFTVRDWAGWVLVGG